MSPLDNYAFPDLPSTIVSRGAAYQRQGRVRLTLRDGALAARVRGTRNYEVTLRYIDGTLVTSCTCPFAEGGESVCKHAVAAAIAANLEAGVPRGSDIRLVAQDDGLSPIARALAKRRESAEELASRLQGSGVTLASKLRKVAAPKPVTATPDAPSKPTTQRREWMSLLDGARSRYGSETEAATPSLIPRSEFRFVLDCEISARPPHLNIRILYRQPLLSGAMGKWRKLDLRRDELALIASAPMRAALALVAATAEMRHTYSPRHEHVPDSISPPDAGAAAILRVLVASGALFALPSGGDAEPIGPLAWDDSSPWELAAELDRTPSRKKLQFTAHLRRGSERRSLEDPLLLLEVGLVVFPDGIAALRHHGAFKIIARLRSNGALSLPLAERTDFLSRLLASVPDLPLSVPPDLALEIHSGKPVHRAMLSPAGDLRTTGVRVDLSHEYDGFTPEPSNAATFIDHARERVVHRDLEAEARAADLLRQLGVATKRHYSQTQGYRTFPWLSSKRMPSAVRALVGAGWKVEAEGVRYRAASRAASGITSGIDWFDLKADVEFDGQVVPLPRLLEALERGDGLVRLGDGSFGLLPEEWLRRFGSLARLGRAVEDGIRFTRAQAGLLDTLLAEMPDISADAAFAKARQQLPRFEGVQAADAPERFAGTLREYQRQGLGWMKGLRQLGLGGVLADDMGLGKTVQVLALLAGLPRKKNSKPCLVIAPRSLIFNWQAEAQRFAPKLRVLDHSGLERSDDPASLMSASASGGHDLILITYGTLRRDILLLREIPFDIVILDEAQAIKNATSETAKAARLLKADQRLALSGTPIENHLGELWSLFDFLNPGVLGTATAFAKIANPGRDVDDETLRLVAGAVRPFVLRRTKTQVAPELPERVEQTLTCILGDKQRAVYDELRDHYRDSLRGGIDEKGIKAIGMQVIEALLRLRQAACHPALINPRWKDSPSTKLDILIPELQDLGAENHAALVFSQFTGLLALVRARLDALGMVYCYLDGSMPAKARQAQVKRFQEGGPPLFLISLKAGGLGLNLTRAEYVYLLDPWWNPAVEAQAIDRAHRIGQRNTVVARRLVAKDTVEERILELQAKKRELADAILSSDGSVLGRLTREELEHLLS